jgi:hypothetical protein
MARWRLLASIERTAYPRFKQAAPVRELHEAFPPTAGEIAWEREPTRTAKQLLALVVLLDAGRGRERAWPAPTSAVSQPRARRARPVGR